MACRLVGAKCKIAAFCLSLNELIKPHSEYHNEHQTKTNDVGCFAWFYTSLLCKRYFISSKHRPSMCKIITRFYRLISSRFQFIWAWNISFHLGGYVNSFEVHCQYNGRTSYDTELFNEGNKWYYLWLNVWNMIRLDRDTNAYMKKSRGLLHAWINYNPTWISIHIYRKVWNESICPYPNPNVCIMEVWKLINDYIHIL